PVIAADAAVAVGKADPTLTSVAAAAAVLSNTYLSDSAFLSGTYRPGGVLTFTLVDPSHRAVSQQTVPRTGPRTYQTPTAVPTSPRPRPWPPKPGHPPGTSPTAVMAIMPRRPTAEAVKPRRSS